MPPLDRIQGDIDAKSSRLFGGQHQHAGKPDDAGARGLLKACCAHTVLGLFGREAVVDQLVDQVPT